MKCGGMENTPSASLQSILTSGFLFLNYLPQQIANNSWSPGVFSAIWTNFIFLLQEKEIFMLWQILSCLHACSYFPPVSRSRAYKVNFLSQFWKSCIVQFVISLLNFSTKSRAALPEWMKVIKLRFNTQFSPPLLFLLLLQHFPPEIAPFFT